MSRARFMLPAVVLAAVSLARLHVPATAASNAPFTAGQAALGASIYSQNCAVCHGAKLQGISAPALAGKASGIATQSVAEVYLYVSQQMPMTAPGSLTPAQYLNVTAYILKRNGHRPSTLPLTVKSAKSSDAVVGVR